MGLEVISAFETLFDRVVTQGIDDVTEVMVKERVTVVVAMLSQCGKQLLWSNLHRKLEYEGNAENLASAVKKGAFKRDFHGVGINSRKLQAHPATPFAQRDCREMITLVVWR